MPETMNLAQKIAAARAELGSLQPDKTNKDQDYKYISADKILERGGDVLAKYGIAIIPSVIDTTITVVERVNKSSRIDAVLKMSMQVTDGATEYIAYWVGIGSDYAAPDKAVYKAITSGHKYFLMKLLNVGVGNEDSEHESGEPKPSANRPSQPSERKTAPAPHPVGPISSDITGTEEEPGDEITEEEARYLDACAAVGSDGVRYGDRTDEKLGWVIAKSKQPEKVTIAKIILDWRKAHNITVK